MSSRSLSIDVIPALILAVVLIGAILVLAVISASSHAANEVQVSAQTAATPVAAASFDGFGWG